MDDAFSPSLSSQVRPFPLLALPNELIQRIGSFCYDHRLAFPSAALNTRLRDIFTLPADIAARSLRHFGCPERALVPETTHGNIPVLEILYQSVNVNAPEAGHALVHSSYHGRFDVVQCLLKHGADPNTNGRHRQPVVVAASEGLLEVMRLLLDHGASNTTEALAAAVTGGNTECVRCLIDDFGVEADIQRIVEAARLGHTSVVELLLDRFPLLNCWTDDLEPLVEAVEEGHVDTVRLLLRRYTGTMPSLRIPIRIAAYRGFADVLEALLDYNDINSANCSENAVQLAVQMAARNGRNSVLQIFRARGVDVEKILEHKSPRRRLPCEVL